MNSKMEAVKQEPEYPGQYQGLIVWYLAWFYVSILNAISDQEENGINDSSEEDATNEGSGFVPEYPGRYQILIIWYLALFYICIHS